MMHYEPLRSEKYLLESMKREKVAVRRQRNKQAVENLITFLLGLGLMLSGVWIASQGHVWFPPIEDFLISQGWI